ncbi:uncharacterized protein LOC128961357 [Oppia nitens]|uniref:uncharacterized protein LOC128961357 n=1 Tax=Oppia nitens TaxID=1686743 RepID=UPI0023DB0DB8|nr:uncharacterized protein LOC128961357 [Oppia nitens]
MSTVINWIQSDLFVFDDNQQLLYPNLSHPCNQVVNKVDKCLDSKWVGAVNGIISQQSCCKARERECSHKRVHRFCYEQYTDLFFGSIFKKCKNNHLISDFDFCRQYQLKNTVNITEETDTCKIYIPCFDNIDATVPSMFINGRTTTQNPCNDNTNVRNRNMDYHRHIQTSMTSATVIPPVPCISNINPMLCNISIGSKINNCLIKKWSLTSDKPIDLRQITIEYCCYHREYTCIVKRLLSKCNTNEWKQLYNSLHEDNIVDACNEMAKIDDKLCNLFKTNSITDSTCLQHIPCPSC